MNLTGMSKHCVLSFLISCQQNQALRIFWEDLQGHFAHQCLPHGMSLPASFPWELWRTLAWSLVPLSVAWVRSSEKQCQPYSAEGLVWQQDKKKKKKSKLRLCHSSFAQGSQPFLSLNLSLFRQTTDNLVVHERKSGSESRNLSKLHDQKLGIWTLTPLLLRFYCLKDLKEFLRAREIA